MLVPEGKTREIDVESFSFSDDETKLLFKTESEPLYRHSETSNYYILDLKTKKLKFISEKGKQLKAILSPDGSKVAYVRDNNIYSFDLNKNIETTVTTDGKWGYIINGATDWVYEEEFDLHQALEWSPDSKYLAYYKFDESKVKEYDITMYGELYPEHFKYKYPKAGEDNSIISIYTFNTETNKSVLMDIGKETNTYIPRIYWTPVLNTLSVFKMNRLQNHLDILFCNADNGKNETVYSEDNKYYIKITNDYHYTLYNNKLIITGEKDGFNHIYLYSYVDKKTTQITKGQWEVINIIDVDDFNKKIYYKSTESGPMNEDIYCINFDGTGKTKININNGENNPIFSKNFKYYINTYSAAGIPPVTTLYTIKNKEIKVLLSNKNIFDNINLFGLTKPEFFTFKTNEGVELNGMMIKPKDFDSTKKYPLLMYCYGGPGMQTVSNSWGYFDYVWYEMLAQKGYIIITVDNRGTQGKGELFNKCTYLQLGKYECEDQIASAKYMSKKQYIDSTRIGIWGWSFGGYLTTLCLTKGANVFKMGIAVAPVTNWRNYDNIYTERFMRTPQENPEGYDDNSPVNFVKKLKGKFLVIHGAADDNVHLQNSMELIDAMVNANKQFEMQFYPNKNHSIYGGYTRLHLYKRMTDFIINNL